MVDDLEIVISQRMPTHLCYKCFDEVRPLWIASCPNRRGVGVILGGSRPLNIYSILFGLDLCLFGALRMFYNRKS